MTSKAPLFAENPKLIRTVRPRVSERCAPPRSRQLRFRPAVQRVRRDWLPRAPACAGPRAPGAPFQGALGSAVAPRQAPGPGAPAARIPPANAPSPCPTVGDGADVRSISYRR
ncbi:hypothetical protein GCM10009864_15010 [Streptomyces lunalinharesii]|uniref:Uncharacterized protein n=1 Tax=Streptomyces lunalinharesii TaxID=333384 RepID=A0ABP6DS95_9ACTN